MAVILVVEFPVRKNEDMLLSALPIASLFGKLYAQNSGVLDAAVAVVPVAAENRLPPVQAKKGHPSCYLIRKNVSCVLFIFSVRNLDSFYSPSE